MREEKIDTGTWRKASVFAALCVVVAIVSVLHLSPVMRDVLLMRVGTLEILRSQLVEGERGCGKQGAYWLEWPRFSSPEVPPTRLYAGYHDSRNPHVLVVDLLQPRLPEEGPPHVALHARRPLDGARLELRRSDGLIFDEVVGCIAAGDYRVFALSSDEGVFEWEGQVVVERAVGGDQRIPLSFQTVALPPLEIFVKEDAVDARARTVTVKLGRPASRVDVRVRAPGGEVVAEARHDEPDVLPGESLTVGWRQGSPADVGSVLVRAWDRHGRYGDVVVSPPPSAAASPPTAGSSR